MFKFLEEKLFLKVREGVVNIVVVIFDDKVNRNGCWWDFVFLLWKKGVCVLFVGVGFKIDCLFLWMLVYSDVDVVILDLFIGLLKNFVGFMKSICDVVSK